MTDTYSAFNVSPVPEPGPDAVAPEVFRGIYGMPMFVTVPTDDLAASVEFWTKGLGFIDLFTIPGAVTHLRRWVFQDVLLVPGTAAPGSPADADAPGLTVSFSCVLNQLDGIVEACEAALPGSTTEPRPTPWNTIDVHVRTPENTHVIMTAARQLDLDGAQARAFEAVGIPLPE